LGERRKVPPCTVTSGGAKREEEKGSATGKAWKIIFHSPSKKLFADLSEPKKKKGRLAGGNAPQGIKGESSTARFSMRRKGGKKRAVKRLPWGKGGESLTREASERQIGEKERLGDGILSALWFSRKHCAGAGGETFRKFGKSGFCG